MAIQIQFRTDQHLSSFIGFDPSPLKELAAGKGEGNPRMGFSRIPNPAAALWEIESWSAYMEKRGPDSDVRLALGLPNTSANTARPAKTSRHGSNAIELDDYASFGGKA